MNCNVCIYVPPWKCSIDLSFRFYEIGNFSMVVIIFWMQITYILLLKVVTTVKSRAVDCTEVRYASFLSCGFTTMAVIIPPERKLAKRTFVDCLG